MSTLQIDSSVDNSDNSVLNTVTDLGAISRAFDTADRSSAYVAGLAIDTQKGMFDLFTRTVDELALTQASALDTVNAGFNTAFDQAQQSAASALGTVNAGFNTAFDQAQQSAATSEERGLESVMDLSKQMFYVLGGVGAVVALAVAYK